MKDFPSFPFRGVKIQLLFAGDKPLNDTGLHWRLSAGANQPESFGSVKRPQAGV